MRRTWARGALIAAVTLALVTLGFVLGRTMVERRASTLSDGPHLRPEVSQRIGDFRRVKVKDGRKVWELTASEAEYLEDQAKVLVTRPQVAFFGTSGENVEIKGREGRIYVSGNNIEKIELGGGIEVKVGDYLVRTAEAIYLQPQDVIVSQGPVEISGSSFALDGHGMVIELGRERLQFVNGVKTTLRGKVTTDEPEEETGARPEGTPAPEPVRSGAGPSGAVATGSAPHPAIEERAAKAAPRRSVERRAAQPPGDPSRSVAEAARSDRLVVSRAWGGGGAVR